VSKLLLAGCLLFMTFVSGLAVRADEGTLPLSLDQVLQSVRTRNPDIAAAERRWEIQREQVRPAGLWENPRFTYIDERFPMGVAGVSAEPIRHYRIEQSIPFPGKLSEESRMKRHEALIAQSNARAKTLEVLSEARIRFYQLFLTDQKIALASQAVELLKSALKAAQARVASNQSSLSDVFAVQAELAKARNDLYLQEQQRSLAALELNALMDRPSSHTLGTAQEPVLADIPITSTEAVALARLNDPSYLSAMHELDHAQAMQARRRLDFAPDFGLLYEYESAPPGPAGRMLGVSVSFPLWFERPLSNYRSAQTHVQEAEAQAESLRRDAIRRVEREFIETTARLQVARNYAGEIVPSALANVDIPRRQYAAGQGDFVRLIEAYRSWLSAHNEYQEALYAYAQHWSELERWIGVDLSRAKELSERRPPRAAPPEMTHEN